MSRHLAPVGVGRRSTISSRGTTWLSRSLLVLSATFVAVVALLLVVRRAGGLGEGDPWGEVALPLVAALSFSLMGTLITARHPANAIGWIFSFMGISLSLSGAAGVFAEAVLNQAAQVPWGTLAAWFASWSWFLFVAPAVVALPLLYPTGRPVTPRWGVLFWIAAAATLLGIVGRALEPGPLTVPGYGVNPLGPASFDAPAELLFHAGVAVVLLCMIGASVSLVVRLGRTRGVERQQLQSFVFVAGLLPITMGAAQVGFVPAQKLFTLVVAALPFATGFAILRQGLYDIDLIIRRTLVYGGVSAVLAVLYFGAIALLQLLLAPFTSGSDLAVAGSTLAVVGAFQPVRRRIQVAVDRRFYREKYDAGQTVDRFGTRLRDEVDLLALERELLTVVSQTVQPAHASLWLRSRAK